LHGLKAKPAPERREQLLTEAFDALNRALAELRPLRSEFPPVARALENLDSSAIAMGRAGVYQSPAVTPAERSMLKGGIEPKQAGIVRGGPQTPNQEVS